MENSACGTFCLDKIPRWSDDEGNLIKLIRYKCNYFSVFSQILWSLRELSVRDECARLPSEGGRHFEPSPFVGQLNFAGQVKGVNIELVNSKDGFFNSSVWIMGAVGCTGNLIVLVGRLLTPTNNIVHSLYLRNLALSDLLMGVYLFIIASVDSQYRHVYLQYEYKWRHAFLCQLCG